MEENPVSLTSIAKYQRIPSKEFEKQYKDHQLNYTLLPKRPEKEINIKLPAITKHKTGYKSPANHLWRHSIILDKLKTQKIKVGHF